MSWFSTSDRCYNGGKRHHFVQRFTEQEVANPLQLAKLDSVERFTAVMASLRKANVLQIYVGDVCRWCGATVTPNRSQP